MQRCHPLAGARALTVLFIAVLLAAVPASAQQYRTLTPEAGAAPAGAGRRVALVVGNAAYTGVTPLRNAANDAADMATALQRVGFTVVSGTNLSERSMEDALRDFSRSLTGAEAALVFYAGHGVEVDGENYLLPVDLDGGVEPFELRHEALALGRVLDALDRSEVPLKMVVLDACRDNPFRSWRSAGGGGWAATQGPEGTIIAYGTAPGARASDNPTGRNGLFTASLLEQLDRPGVEVSRMFRLAGQRVVSESRGAQQPYLSLGYLGDFYFVPSQSDMAPDVPSHSAPAAGSPVNVSQATRPSAAPRPATVDAWYAEANAAFEAQNWTAAAGPMRRAAEAGDAEAQSRMGGLCYDGLGVPQSDTEAVRWYRLAADQGFVNAQYRLAGMYLEGRGVLQDDNEAFRRYRRLADQGHPSGQTAVGFMYAEGRGVPQSDTEAVRWYRLAADQQSSEGQYRLGVMYRDGRGLPRDCQEARRLFGLAVLAGNASARTALTDLGC